MTQPMDDLMLPPLTHVGWEVDGVEPVYAYTADQMREYAKQAVEAERERLAKFFDANDTVLFWGSRAATEIRARSKA